MGKTIEQKVAESILQQPEIIEIGGKRYTVAKPSTATLIMASAAISKLPRFVLKEKTMVSDVLREAKDADGIGEVIAIMIVGTRYMHRFFFVRWFKMWRIRRLKWRLLEEHGNGELQRLAYQLFSKMEVGDFFGLIAFLGEVNMTKPTKATTTASGQQSEVS